MEIKKISLSLAVILSTTLFADDESTRLSEVTVVSASGFEQNIKDAPATISVISAEEIKNKSYSDISDVLKNVPGLFITNGGSNQSIMMRGMGDDYTLFLIDGKPMQNDQVFTQNGGQAGVQMNFLPSVDNIESIEIIRGPASSLYGSDAMGGVVNIITKKKSEEVSGSVSFEYLMADSNNKVNNDGLNTSFTLRSPLIDDFLYANLSGSFNYNDESDFAGGGTESTGSDPEYKNKKLATKFIITPNDNNTIDLEYMYNKQERTHTPGKSLPLTQTIRGVTSATELSEIVSYKDTYSISHEYKNDNFLIKSYITYDDAKNPSRRNTTTGNYIMSDTLVVNSQGTIFFDNHVLSLGATYKDETYKDGATNSINTAGYTTVDRYQYSLFAEDEWSLTDDLSLFLSARYDDNEDFGSNISPKLYTVYHLTDEITLKGGVTTGYKAPNLKQSSQDFLGVSRGGNYFGNPDLEPETSVSYEASISYDNADDLSASLTVYKTDFEDMITRSDYYVCPSGTSTCNYNGETYTVSNSYGFKEMINIDEAEIKGIELTTDYQITQDLKYRHSYTYTDSEQKTGSSAGEPLNDISKHMFNAGVDWDITPKLLSWAQVNYRSKTMSKETPSYMFADVGLVYRIKSDVTLKAGVYNITNKEVTSDEGYSYVLDGRRYSFAIDIRF
ncbi:TonB-dependent receptor domain-containing protein [Halarcobacter sp.]|uniref:TonB-dependent receptor domain-containing protein n=1 Tax=Halarcobacter sp. TaxID=2321133 RepID=UPI002AA8DBCB|nr:TonB-dependent receptor [Halarcobacter sp.]